MQNGLYTVQFSTPLGAGAGVVHVRDGELRGGDSGMFYVGIYKTEASGEVHAQLSVRRHSPGVSVFGKDPISLTLVGHAAGNTLTFRGTAKEAPGVNFGAVLSFVQA